MSDRCRNIERRRQICFNSIEKILNTLVLISGTRDGREDLTSDCFLTDGVLDFFDCGLFFHENLFHDSIIEVGKSFNKDLMIDMSLFDIMAVFSRNFVKRDDVRLHLFRLLRIDIP